MNIFACDKQKCMTFQKHFQAKRACQAMFVVVAKRISMFDEQNSKRLSSNDSTFGQGR